MAREIPDQERLFLERYDATEFDRPSVAVDAVVLTVVDQVLRVVLVQRGSHPFQGAWALPGGFVRIDEGLEEAVRRNLSTKAGLSPDHLEQLYTFGDPGRDPRLRVISVAWLAVIRQGRLTPEGLRPGTALAEVRVDWSGEQGGPATAWVPDGQLPLAFDHDLVLGTAVQRIRGKIGWTELAFSFLPERFTLRELRLVYETLLGRELNKDSFRRTVLARHPLADTGLRQEAVGHRPAALYTLEPSERR